MNQTSIYTIQLLKVKHWYVVYTSPHHEKKVYKLLQENNIEAFLPLQLTLRQWSDRKKKVLIPLFSCYLFVFITIKDYYRVLNLPGVIRYVSFRGKAAIVPEKQIKTIKDLLCNNIELEEAPIYFQRGSKVTIVYGSLTGLKGELIMYNNCKRVIINIEEISKALLVNIPVNYIKLIG